MSEQKGPGETRWEANPDGSIDCIRHNDPSWRSQFINHFSLTPSIVASSLREAYQMGRWDQAALVRRAIEYGPRRR
jgi:hypothetical protein